MHRSRSQPHNAWERLSQQPLPPKLFHSRVRSTQLKLDHRLRVRGWRARVCACGATTAAGIPTTCSQRLRAVTSTSQHNHTPAAAVGCSCAARRRAHGSAQRASGTHTRARAGRCMATARSPVMGRAWEDLRKTVSAAGTPAVSLARRVLAVRSRPPAPAVPARACARRHAHPPQQPTHHTQARKLEGELDVKLASYAKLCSGYEAEKGSAADQVCV
jgi:hypothetical protein